MAAYDIPETPADDQDRAEVLDETNLTPDGEDIANFDEMAQVCDVTSESEDEGTGASPDDIEDETDPDEEKRLEEGLKETFPASDPVSAKHIT